jgi:hypothetical protein
MVTVYAADLATHLAAARCPVNPVPRNNAATRPEIRPTRNTTHAVLDPDTLRRACIDPLEVNRELLAAPPS